MSWFLNRIGAPVVTIALLLVGNARAQDVDVLPGQPTEVRNAPGAFQDYQNTQNGGTADVDLDGLPDHTDRYDQRDASGFIRLNALRLKLR